MPSYIAWLVRERVYAQRPQLKQVDFGRLVPWIVVEYRRWKREVQESSRSHSILAGPWRWRFRQQADRSDYSRLRRGAASGCDRGCEKWQANWLKRKNDIRNTCTHRSKQWPMRRNSVMRSWNVSMQVRSCTACLHWTSQRQCGSMAFSRTSLVNLARSLNVQLPEDLVSAFSVHRTQAVFRGLTSHWKIAATCAWNAGKEFLWLWEMFTFPPQLEEVTVQRILSENWLTQCYACTQIYIYIYIKKIYINIYLL